MRTSETRIQNCVFICSIGLLTFCIWLNYSPCTSTLKKKIITTLVKALEKKKKCYSFGNYLVLGSSVNKVSVGRKVDQDKLKTKTSEVINKKKKKCKTWRLHTCVLFQAESQEQFCDDPIHNYTVAIFFLKKT